MEGAPKLEESSDAPARELPTEKKGNARDALLQSAQCLFTAKGYDAVSTREIAEHAGVNLGTIQYHFGSKAQLFIETIRRVMQREEEGPLVLDEQAVETKEDAVSALCGFINHLLFTLCFPQGPDVCKLMYRESLGAACEDPLIRETLISSVVDEIIRPIDQRLQKIVSVLAPEAGTEEINLIVHSIIGQCSFYVTHRRFIGRLRGADCTEEPAFSLVRRHVASFTLKALGVEASLINSALATMQADDSFTT